MNMVMIPYCTGDAHAGDAVVEMMVGSVARPTYFVGAKNAALALARLGATFPDLDRVFLAGTSAGGGGRDLSVPRGSATPSRPPSTR
jgi:hypothetical protein